MVNPVTQKVTNDAVRELGKAISDLGKNVDKGIRDTGNEIERARRNIETAGAAIAEYVQAKTEGTIKSTSNALERVREGKAIDALWHIGTDQIRIEDQAASKAALKSEIIRTVGQIAASVYGGPGGAAAYAAWLTYHQSGGDVELALKVGIIAGATSWAMQGAGKMPTEDATGNLVVSSVGKKVAVTAAIGGLAVAAAGGNEDAVRDGFLRAGAMVLIQEGYHNYTKHALNEEALKASKDHLTVSPQLLIAETSPRCSSLQGWKVCRMGPIKT